MEHLISTRKHILVKNYLISLKEFETTYLDTLFRMFLNHNEFVYLSETSAK